MVAAYLSPLLLFFVKRVYICLKYILNKTSPFG